MARWINVIDSLWCLWHVDQYVAKMRYCLDNLEWEWEIPMLGLSGSEPEMEKAQNAVLFQINHAIHEGNYRGRSRFSSIEVRR